MPNMHSISEFGANVPAFLAKLWKLVDDSETNDLISWSEEGSSFFIRDQAQFSRKLLPMYYKHNNMASFIRQLNMYGFHKIVSADAGSLRLDKDEMEFAHQCFLRGHPYLLEHIKRKVGKSQLLTSKHIEEGKEGSGGVVVKAEIMNKILTEVQVMRGRQETVESRLTSMKQENEALWRELSLLRQKHIKQQTIVNKLIQFLVTLVQPSQRLNKRRYPLMINSVAHPSEKSNGKVMDLHTNDQQRPLLFSLRASQNNMSQSPSGPTIHELDGDSVPPETDTEFLSNTITLHVPDSGLTEVIDTDLEPEALSSNTEVLDNLDPSVIQDPLAVPSLTVPDMEVNSILGAVGDEAFKTSVPSPETLVAVPPREVNPGVIVPDLRIGKVKPTSLIPPLPLAEKELTQSSSAAEGPAARPAGGSRSLYNSSKAGSFTSKSTYVSSKGLATNGSTGKQNVQSQPVCKKEFRVAPARNRRKKQQNRRDSSVSLIIDPPQDIIKPVDLLAEAGLADLASSDGNIPSPTNADDGITNGSNGGCVNPPTPNRHVAFPMPESPIPIVHSPVASPSTPPSYCSMAQPVSMSPLSATTITDITSPLIIYPSSNVSSEQLSPQVSPSGGLSSPFDLTLACTSQAGSPSTNSSPIKSSPFNRDEFDTHVGSMDSDLNQLKELLNNSGIQIDANTLLGLFSNEDSAPLSEADGNNLNLKVDPTGNELMYYQPDFMDLEEIWNSENNQSTPPLSPVETLTEVNTPLSVMPSPGFSGPAAKRRRN